MSAEGMISVKYSGQEITGILFEPIAKVRAREYGFRMLDGVKGTGIIKVKPPLRNILKPGSSEAYGTPQAPVPTGSLQFQTLKLQPLPMKAYLEFDSTEFDGSDLIEALAAGAGINDLGLADMLMEQLLADSVIDGVDYDHLRMMFFGDTTNTDDNYSSFDGVWKQIKAAVTAGTLTPQLVTPNTPLSAGGSIDIFKAVWKKAPVYLRQLFSRPDVASMLRFYVSQNVLDDYTDSIGARAADAGIMILLNGIPTPTWKGVPVQVMPGWELDAIGSKLFVSGGSTPITSDFTGVILSYSENIVGAFDADPDSQFRAWYDINTDLSKVRTKFKGDAGYCTNDLISVAYSGS